MYKYRYSNKDTYLNDVIGREWNLKIGKTKSKQIMG